MNPKETLQEALRGLTADPDPLLSNLAEALSAMDTDTVAQNDAQKKAVYEQLLSLISRQVAEGASPSAVPDALASIDAYLAAHTSRQTPLAAPFIATARTLRDYLQHLADQERRDREIADQTPIRETHKILTATPPAPLGPLGATQLTERILRAVLHKKPSKVCLRLSPSNGDSTPTDLFADLAADLAAQKIPFQLDTQEGKKSDQRPKVS